VAERGPESWNVCSSLLHANCDATLQSASSFRLGLPLAGWGVVFYATLTCLLVLGLVLSESFENEAHVAALLLALSGGAISVWLLSELLSGRAPWCPLCVVVHGINLTLVVAIQRHRAWTWARFREQCRAGIHYLFGGATAAPRQMAWKSVTFLVPALLAVVLYQWVMLEVSLRTMAARAAGSPAVVIRDYQSQPEREIPVPETDPRWGDDDAPIKLVVFSGFTCAGCRQLAHELTFLQEHFRGKVLVVFKHFPLSSDCNPQVAANQHPRACAAAVLAETAHRQGQFWPVHNALFALPSFEEPRLQQLVRDLRLDELQLERAAQDPQIAEKIHADAELGGRLGVTATPTVYLNNRHVTNLNSGVLDILIHHLLGEQGH